MVSTNKLQELGFVPFSNSLLMAMENMPQSELPLSACLPSSQFLWDINNSYLCKNISDSFMLISRPGWIDEAQDVLTSTYIKIKDDFETLIHAARKLGITRLAQLPIAEELVEVLSGDYTISEDLDHAEYIYRTSDLSKLEGSDYAEIRSKGRKFIKLYPQHSLKVQTKPPDSNLEKQISHLYESWLEMSGHDVASAADHEKKAFKKLLGGYRAQYPLDFLYKKIYYYLYIGESLVGFSVVEQVKDDYSVGHFMKLNHNVSGISEYFIQKIAEDLHSRGTEFLNTEEDLGYEGLRAFKHHMRPVKQLMLYSVDVG